MPVSDSLFCFTSNKIHIHPCPDCRAPILVRINSAGLGWAYGPLNANCNKIAVISVIGRNPFGTGGDVRFQHTRNKIKTSGGGLSLLA
jgi:hypothetical protein